MKRLLILMESYRQLGGIERVSLQLAQWLGPYCRVGILSMSDGAVPFDLDDGEIDFWQFPDSSSVNSAENRRFAAALIREQKYEIVINQGIVSDVYLDFQADPNCRFVNVLHSCIDWLYVRRHLIDWKEQVAACPSLRNVGRYVFVKCFPHWSERKVSRDLRAQIEGAAAFVVLAPQYKKELEKRLYGGKAQPKLCAIPNPVWPFPLSEDCDASGLPVEKPCVLYAGRMSRAYKRLDRLIRIWKRVSPHFPEWTLRLVGEGPDRPRLQRMVEKLGLTSVEFRPVCHDASLYEGASVFCLTSSFEGMSLSVLEAQRAGLPVVAFDINEGMRLAVADGESGFLVKPFDEKAFAHQLSLLLENTSKRREMKKAACRQAALFDMEHIGPMWLKLFEELGFPSENDSKEGRQA